MNHSKAIAALLLLPLALPVAGAETGQPDPLLEPIVVTATLGPKTAGESLSSVTVLDEATIREQNPAEFQDLLRGQPGISVVGNGSFGKSTSVYTRGTTNDSTLFLVDGVRLRSATSGGAAWQYFPAELVERVEIVRGPRSALYGADAVGGVIQAFTLDPKQGNRGWVEAGAGNFDTQKVAAGAGASAGNTRFSLSGLHKETDGAPVVEGGEDKGFRNTAGVGRIVHELASGGEASVVLMQTEGNTEYDSGNIDFLMRTLGLRLDTPVSEQWHSSVQFAESRDEMENFTSFGNSVFNTRTRSARWDNTLTFDVHELVLGAELLTDEVSGTTDFVETSRTNSALFSQLRLNFGPTDLMLSLRGDDNEAFGKQETGGIALGHSFDRSHRVRVSYGTAFRAPTFNDLYYPLEVYDFGGSYSGNPDLQPEESGTVELGISGNYASWFWDAAVYQMDVDNLIALRTDDTGAMAPENIDEARIRGAELSAGFDRAGWRGQAALTLTDPRDQATDNRLRRRSAQSVRLDLDKTINTWSFGGSVVAEGYRYDDAANTKRLPGYGTLDLRAGWRFADDWSGRLTVANVLDKAYATAERFDGARYIAAGRTAMLTVRYDIQ
ncbi:TonB-dependent receptor domain-containing protein [Marinobacter profundi]|uniref:TonB-dependent receptor n=1 Tax=Marinobacter profundi TaxID=2666256 RepID=A0A2G1ULP5_9GAMM|nr:TonB-dependent receptor [Marinobacter profundi]PHQ15383.1 TonB-dependent receptor [Marinobacter profundi]